LPLQYQSQPCRVVSHDSHTVLATQINGACVIERLPLTTKQYIFYTNMEFEFDSEKSAQNLAKHGIDFMDAQKLWDDPDLLEIPARTEDEPRYLVIGRIGTRHWSGVITYRSDNIRIISVRRSRPDEVALYES